MKKNMTFKVDNIEELVTLKKSVDKLINGWISKYSNYSFSIKEDNNNLTLQVQLTKDDCTENN